MNKDQLAEVSRQVDAISNEAMQHCKNTGDSDYMGFVNRRKAEIFGSADECNAVMKFIASKDKIKKTWTTSGKKCRKLTDSEIAWINREWNPNVAHCSDFF